MIRRFSRLHLGLLASGLVAAVAIGCGGDDDNDDPAVTAGSGGKGGSTSGQGGDGDAGDPGTGDAGETSSGGGGGQPPVTEADIDDVIRAVCDWEFRCCDEGEIRFRLAPTATTAEECAADFIAQLRESNVATNPFIAGNAVGLLGQLGYMVNLERVTVNAANVAACVEQWEDRDCNSPPEPDARCGGAPEADPCALTSLFEPTLGLDERCTLALAEGVFGNDVECLPGSTCLPADHPDNPNDFPACVRRGLDGAACISDQDCDYDYFCNDGGDCEEKAGPGEDCAFEDPDQPAAGEETIQCKAGLTCHPVDFTCTEPCTVGFRCTDDSECPEDTSCAPLTVGNDTTSFKVCRPLGEDGNDRCDSDADCVPTAYCTGGPTGACQNDVALGNACTKSAMCPSGLYCDTVATGQCQQVLLPNTACAALADDACGPAPARCVAGSCSAGPVNEGDDCDEDDDCKPGLICDYASAAATTLTCITGGEERDPCDDNVLIATEPRCAAGLFCNADSECAVQVGPGGDCEDPDTMAANNAMCTNGMCSAHWEDELMCTDGPVPASAGGTNVTCDGN